MKNITYIFLFLMLSCSPLFSQNVGIGTTIPSQLLHVKDGNLYVENGEIRLDLLGSKIYRSGSNVVVGSQANLRLNTGSVYDVSIQSGGITYANFEGNTKTFGLGIGSTTPSELFHMKGGNLFIENGELLLNPFGSKLKTSGSNVNLEAEANLRLNPGVNYDVVVQSGGVTYATFEGDEKRLGIGTVSPATDLDVFGITRSEEFQIENSNSRLYNFSTATFLENDGHIVFNAGQGNANDGIFFQDNGVNRAKFDNGRFSIGGSFTANESIHTTGALLIGSAAGTNKGTIQWDGNDFLGATNDGWKSMTSVDEIVDADVDTGISLVEGTLDQIDFEVNGTQYMELTDDADGGRGIHLFGDSSAGPFQKIQHQYYMDDIVVATVGPSGSAANLDISAIDRVNIRGNYIGDGDQAYLQVGKFFTTAGVGISTSGYVTGSLRGTLDVKGTIACDGAQINDVLSLTPMPQPVTASEGDVYMDDGSCTGCGGDVKLRYYNGVSWKTL